MNIPESPKNVILYFPLEECKECLHSTPVIQQEVVENFYCEHEEHFTVACLHLQGCRYVKNHPYPKKEVE